MKPGYLVEFFEEKRLLCGLIMELKGERFRVLTQNGRELTLAPKRVLHACPSPISPEASRQRVLALLEETVTRREALKNSINLDDLWDLLAQEDQSLTVEEMAELWFGRGLPDEIAALARALREERFLFRYKEGRWLPHAPEVVENLREQHRRELERRRELEEVAAWLQAVWAGDTVPAPPYRDRVVELLRRMAVSGPEAPEYEEGKAFLDQARLNPGEAPFRLLVRLGVFEEDEDLDAHRLEVPQEFSPQARELSSVLARSLNPDPYAGRVDLTGLECFTIDGEQTRDFDDALSLEEVPQGRRLGIHIADVASVVAPGTPLDLEAQARGTSIYLPERRLPMLPEEISEDTLSLLAHQERRALSFLVTLDGDGEIKDWRILPSLIKVQQRLTYDEVNRGLSQDRKLAELYTLTQRLKERRLAVGGYELRLPEVWVNFTPGGELRLALEDQETPSRELVAEAMVLANSLAARFLAENGIPAIYRTQPEPREPLRREEGKSLWQLWQERRRLSRVVMDLTPQPHWGLGLDCYTLATSPIRRYLDLLMHRQMLAVLSEAPPPYTRQDLERIITTIGPSMRRAGFLKTRRLRYWLLKYLAGRVGQKLEALVLDAVNHRYRVLLPALMLEASLPAPASLKLTPGSAIQVRVDRVAPREDQVKLSLV